MHGRSRSRGSRGARSGAVFLAAALAASACSVNAHTPEPGEEIATALATPELESAPNAIEHPTGSADVVLRFDRLPDYLEEGELNDALFRPGSEFTLYGDGTVIFLRDGTLTPLSNRPIERAAPFRTARLTDTQVQALLRYALDVGGLASAQSYYPSGDTDCVGSWEFTLRTVSISADVEVVCPLDWQPLNQSATAFEPSGDSLSTLANYLRRFDTQIGIETSVWEPDRYWAILSESPEAVGPEPMDWPWPELDPKDFSQTATEFRWMDTAWKHAISAAEADQLELAEVQGGIQGIPVRSPNGRKSWRLALWPIFPDDDGRSTEVPTLEPSPVPSESRTPEPTPTPSPTPEASPTPDASPTSSPSATPTLSPTPWPFGVMFGEGVINGLPFKFTIWVDHEGRGHGTFAGRVPRGADSVAVDGPISCARINQTTGVFGYESADEQVALWVLVSDDPDGMTMVLGRSDCITPGADDPATHPITEGHIEIIPEPTPPGT